MSRVSRRQAMFAAAAMGGAAALAALGKPTVTTSGGSPLDLDRLFSSRFGDWQADVLSNSFVRPPVQEGKAYGLYDQILERTYVDARGERMMLSVAYGREQSASMQLHRPEVCYRFGGFQVEGIHPASIAVGGEKLPVTRLHAVKPGRSEPLTYWATLGDELVDGRLSFRLRQLSFGLRRRTLDGMLVRVSSIDDDVDRAYERQAAFSSALVRALPIGQRAKVIGRVAASAAAAG